MPEAIFRAVAQVSSRANTEARKKVRFLLLFYYEPVIVSDFDKYIYIIFIYHDTITRMMRFPTTFLVTYMLTLM